MKYTKGTIGRVFVMKFDDGDIFLEKLAYFAKKEKLKAAAMIFIGALKRGDLVTGPKRPVIPPLPNKIAFKDAWEALGIGTIFTNKEGPQIHIHGAMGKRINSLIGCVRGKSEVFLVVEAVVFELKGVKATKDIDISTGLNLLRII